MILRMSAVLGLCLAGASSPPAMPAGFRVAGLQLLDGAPPAPEVRPAPSRASPAPGRGGAPPASRAPVATPTVAPGVAAPEPPAARSAADQAIDAAVQQLAGGSPPIAAAGAPPSPAALAVLDAIADGAGLARGGITATMNGPREIARFLLERLRDREIGATRLPALFGRPGEIAVAGWQRARDRFQVLALAPEQMESAVDLVAGGLVAAQLADAVEDPRHLLLAVDPGPGLDRARFERAVGAEHRVARCLRPLRAGLDRAYQLSLLRDGQRTTSLDCIEPWRAPADPAGPPLIATRPGAPTDSGGEPAAAAPGSGLGLPAPAPPGAFIVTDGPDGPVVRRVPAERPR